MWARAPPMRKTTPSITISSTPNFDDFDRVNLAMAYHVRRRIDSTKIIIVCIIPALRCNAGFGRDGSHRRKPMECAQHRERSTLESLHPPTARVSELVTDTVPGTVMTFVRRMLVFVNMISGISICDAWYVQYDEFVWYYRTVSYCATRQTPQCNSVFSCDLLLECHLHFICSICKEFLT